MVTRETYAALVDLARHVDDVANLVGADATMRVEHATRLRVLLGDLATILARVPRPPGMTR